VYQIVVGSKMEVQVLFFQGVCVGLSNYDYLLILAIVKIIVWFNLREKHMELQKLKIDLVKDSSGLDFMNEIVATITQYISNLFKHSHNEHTCPNFL